MTPLAPVSNHRPQDHFHPAVYRTMAAFAITMVIAVWAFVGNGGPTTYILAVVSAFLLGSLGLPYLLRTVRRVDRRPWRGSTPPAASGQRFGDWAAGDFRIWQGRLGAREAMIQAVLPIAAVGIGMVVFAIAMIVATGNTPG